MLSFQIFLLFACLVLFSIYMYIKHSIRSIYNKNKKIIIPAVLTNDIQRINNPHNPLHTYEKPCPFTTRIRPVENQIIDSLPYETISSLPSRLD